MAELTKAMLAIGAMVICCAGFPPQAQSTPAPSDIRWVKIPCAAWCNDCRPTYSCYQHCARLGGPKVRIGCGGLRRLPAVPVPPKSLWRDR